MNTVAAQDIKRKGISAVDEALKEGPVHIIKNNQPQYVVITEARYRELIEAADEAYMASLQKSLQDVKDGRITRGTAEDLIRELELED